MREKLLDLMKNEGLKPSQLAELLDVNPAGISHLMAGRNKPSFELLQKILRRFPRLNPDWLLLDSTLMYRDAAATLTSPSETSDLFGQPPAAPGQPEIFTPSTKPGENRMETPDPNMIPKYSDSEKLRVERVVVFYSDHSFDSYTPKQ